MEVRDSSSCVCTSCSVVCRGRFPGCPSVWSTGQSELPTALERDREFIALPYVGMEPDSAPSPPLPPETPVRTDEPLRLEAALALQEAVNNELLHAIRRLEETVAELTAAPSPPSPSAPKEAARRSVDVLQWVEAGASRSALGRPRSMATTGPLQEHPRNKAKNGIPARDRKPVSRRSRRRRKHGR